MPAGSSGKVVTLLWAFPPCPKATLSKQEVNATISGMPGNYKHLERAVSLRGNRSDPTCLEARAEIAQVKENILTYLDAFQLDGIVGGAGLSLLAASGGMPIVSDCHQAKGAGPLLRSQCTAPAGMFPGLLESQALCFVGRPDGGVRPFADHVSKIVDRPAPREVYQAADSARAVAEEVFSPSPLPPIG